MARDRLIVLYVGGSAGVTNVLEAMLGSQFAGRSGSLEDITWILESYGEPERRQSCQPFQKLSSQNTATGCCPLGKYGKIGQASSEEGK